MSPLAKIRRVVAAEGMAGFIARLRAKLRRAAHELSPHRFRQRRAERDFDRALGISTRGIIGTDSLGLEGDSSREAVRYQPTSLAAFRHMIERLPIYTADYTFVDVGSGKGRTLFLAAEFDFQRIIGVEFSQKLHALAEANVKRARKKGSTAPIELVREDATRYAFPDEPTVLYLYNPFTGSMARRFFEHLVATVEARFRDVIVIYNNPSAEEHLAGSVWFEKIDEGIGYVTYRTRRIAA